MGAIPLSESGKGILYDAPTTSVHSVQLKKYSYPKGFFPSHLKEFRADKTGLNECPVDCKGETGLSYAACLRACARRKGITKAE